jgi:predicted PurR-regulated permease PerM
MLPTNVPAEQIIRLIVAAALLVGSLYVLSPLIAPIAWAGIFVISSWPLYQRLSKRVRSASAAAGIATAALLLLFALPIALMAASFFDLADTVIGYLRNHNLPPAPEALAKLPYIGTGIAAKWNEAVADIPAFLNSLKPYQGPIRNAVLGIGAALAQAVIMLLLSAVFAFFLFRDGSALGMRLQRMSLRIGGERGRTLLLVAESTTRSVVYGIVGTAAVQGVLAMIGLAIAGVPGALLLGLFVGLLALIPVGLTALIMLPAAGWLFLEGNAGWGLFLALWGVFVVGSVDNFVRPVLISRGSQLPLSIVLTGIIGGLLTMGVLGLFIGAVLLGVAFVMLREWSSMRAEDEIAAVPSTAVEP